MGPGRARAIAERMVDTLALLHAVVPAEVGLADFGRPEGFLARQVRRWQKQLDASRSRPIPGIDELHALLDANTPAGTAPTIVHGDYRLDNVLVGPDDKVAAVVGLGDGHPGRPADRRRAAHRVPADGPARRGPDGERRARLPRRGGDPRPLRREFSGRDLSDLGFYIALASFKTAVVLEGIHYRYVHGQTVGEGFESIGTLVEPLVASGLAAIKEDS